MIQSARPASSNPRLGAKDTINLDKNPLSGICWLSFQNTSSWIETTKLENETSGDLPDRFVVKVLSSQRSMIAIIALSSPFLPSLDNNPLGSSRILRIESWLRLALDNAVLSNSKPVETTRVKTKVTYSGDFEVGGKA